MENECKHQEKALTILLSTLQLELGNLQNNTSSETFEGSQLGSDVIADFFLEIFFRHFETGIGNDVGSRKVISFCISDSDHSGVEDFFMTEQDILQFCWSDLVPFVLQ